MVASPRTIVSVVLALSPVLFANPSDVSAKLDGYIPPKNQWQVLFSNEHCIGFSFHDYPPRVWSLLVAPRDWRLPFTSRIHWTPELRAALKDMKRSLAVDDKMYALARKIYKDVESEAIDTSIILPSGTGHTYYPGPHDRAMIVIVSPKHIHRAYKRNLETPFQDERLRKLEAYVTEGCRTTFKPTVP